MSRRLVTLDTYRARYQGTGPVAPADDAAVLARIDAVSGAVLAHLGYPEDAGWDSATRVDTWGPDDWPWHPWTEPGRVTPRFCPVSSVTSVEYSGDGGTYTALDSQYYSLADSADPSRVRVAAVRGYLFDRGLWYRLTYTAGYTAVPAALEDAAGRLIAWSLALDRRRGVQSESGSGQPGQTYRPETWPEDLQAALRPYRLPWHR